MCVELLPLKHYIFDLLLYTFQSKVMTMKFPALQSDHSDLFDGVPDPIISLIFNRISDVKSLIRCRSVSKRFNSLVPESDSLLLLVDRVISTTGYDADDGGSVFATFFKSILKSFHCLISPNKQRLLTNNNPTRSQNSPAEILRGFERIRSLRIQLPAGDLKLEKGSSINWKANFGKNLRSCVILGFRSGGCDAEFGGSELKLRVIWTISALISASARHFMMADVIREQRSLTELIVTDKDDEGTIVMDKAGLKEFRLTDGDEEIFPNNNNINGGLSMLLKSNRTPVPAVRMRVKHESKIVLSNGVTFDGATLVVIRPRNDSVSISGGVKSEAEEHGGDVALAMDAFGGDGIYREVVEKLLKSKTYVLEMNSF